MRYTFFILFLLTCFLGPCQENKLVFEEQFEGETLDVASWNYMLGDGCPNLCGWGNNERQIYTKENVSLRDGHLIITANKKGNRYTSSRITTKKKVEFQYGTIEVRAKLPQGQGIWPAIWLLGNDIETNVWPNCGEIDMMEYVGNQPGVVHTSLHTASSFGNTVNTKKTKIVGIENDFHVYKTVWDKNSISFFIDEMLVYSYAPEVKTEKTWPFDKPFYMILNMAIGGNFGGPDVDDTIFPQEFTIDYIKIYESNTK